MIGYVTLGTNNPVAALAFYDGLLAEIGASRIMELDNFVMYGTGMDAPSLVITPPNDGAAATAGNGNMVALQVDSRAAVEALHSRALALGGSCEGLPGLRGPDEMGFYAAYFRDPEGNKLAAFRVGPA